MFSLFGLSPENLQSGRNVTFATSILTAVAVLSHSHCYSRAILVMAQANPACRRISGGIQT